MIEILKFIGDYGFTTVFAAGAGALLYKYFSNKITPVRHKTITYEKLLDHKLFWQLKHWLNYKLNHLDIPCPCRKAVFQDLLKLEFSIIYDEVYQTFISANMMKYIDEEIERLALNTITNIFAKCEQKAKDSGIPDVVYLVYRKWSAQRISFIKEMIIKNSYSTFFQNNAEKLNAILDAVLVVVNLAVIDAEKTLLELNGDLDDMVYNGISCQHCDVCHAHSARNKKLLTL